ncbi:hypothetical protein CDAR_566171, partial [Caerostris darwini]
MQALYQRYGGLFVWCSGFYQNNEQDDIKFSCVSLSLSSYSSDVEPKDSYIPSLEEATQDKCKRFLPTIWSSDVEPKDSYIPSLEEATQDKCKRFYQRYGGLFVWCSGFYQNNEQDDIKFSCVSLSLSSYSSDVEPKDSYIPSLKKLLKINASALPTIWSSDVEPKDSYIPSLEEATQDKCKSALPTIWSSDVEPKDSYIPSLEEATQDKCKRFTNDME